MPSTAATATDAAAAVVFESVSLGIGLAPTAGPPACAVASPTISASKPAAISFMGRIDIDGWGVGVRFEPTAITNSSLSPNWPRIPHAAGQNLPCCGGWNKLPRNLPLTRSRSRITYLFQEAHHEPIVDLADPSARLARVVPGSGCRLRAVPPRRGDRGAAPGGDGRGPAH